MDEVEIKKLTHDFLNSISIINSLSKSSNNCLDKIVEGIPGFDTKIELMKKAMLSIQHEACKIEQFFLQAINK